MAQSAHAAGQGILACMRASRPGVHERELCALFGGASLCCPALACFLLGLSVRPVCTGQCPRAQPRCKDSGGLGLGMYT